MSTTEETELIARELNPDPEDLKKNPATIREAQELIGVMDVLVCGQCHSVFHFVEQFVEHRDSVACSGKSPVRDSTESKHQVWAFMLWKCSTVAPEIGANRSWKLYQQWCKMDEVQRGAWITAGKTVQTLSKFSQTKIEVKSPGKASSPVLKAKSEEPTPNPTASVVRKRGRPSRKEMAEKMARAKKSLKVDEDFQVPSSGETDDESTLKDEEKKIKPKIVNSVKIEQDEIKTSPIKKLPMTPLLNKTITPKGKISSYASTLAKVPPEGRIAKRTEKKGGEIESVTEYVVEKILAKRYNMRKKQHEYLLKWEGYTHDQNTWEPVENMGTCRHLLDAFEKQLARQKEIKAMRAAQVVTKAENEAQPTFTPTGRLQRNSKARAMDQVKAWCGAELPAVDRKHGTGGSFSDDEPLSKRIKREPNSSGEDVERSKSPIDMPAMQTKTVQQQQSPNYKLLRVPADQKHVVNGSTTSPGSRMSSDADLAKSLGIGTKLPQIKGVIKVDPKEMPNLTTGVYIMSKNSGIMRLDSPGKLGPGLNIDQDMIRKQILAAKQAAIKKKAENQAGGAKDIRTPGKPRPVTPGQTRLPVNQLKKPGLGGTQQIVEKTIITPSGQKIIQRSIQRAPLSSDGNTILNKLSVQDQNLLRRVAAAARGRGRGGTQIIRFRDRPGNNLVDNQTNGSEEDTSDDDYVTDPFPKDLPPIPPPSPDRDLTLCPLTGKRLARAEGEPTPPPTPPPPPSPQPLSETSDVVMKVEMSPGGTTGTLVGGTPQPSLPQLLVDDDGDDTDAGKVVKRLFSNEDVDALSGNEPIMIQGEDGVLYQVAGKNEAGQTLLVPAEGVEGNVEGGMRDDGVDGEGRQCVYVAQQEGGEVLTIDPAQLAQLIPDHGGGSDGLGEGIRQVAVQVEGESGEDSTQVIAQLVQADLPSPGGTRKVVLLLPDGSFTITELDNEQYASITDADKGPE